MHRLSPRHFGAVGLFLCASAAFATIGPPVQVRVVGELPDFALGQRRTVTLEITSSERLALDTLQLGGRGWTLHSTDMPAQKSMAEGEQFRFQAELSGSDPNQPLSISLFAGDQYFEHDFDFSPQAVARSRGPVPGRAHPADPGAPHSDLPADADAGAGAAKAARDIRVWGKVWTTRPDDVDITAPYAKIHIWEDDVDPNPDDFILETFTDENGTFDVTFYWDAVSEAEPDLYFTFWYDNGNVRVHDGNGSTYGYNTTTTSNYTGTFLSMGTWFPATGFEPTGFLFSHISRGSEILWLDGNATQVWDTPQVNCQWFPGSTNGPDYNDNLLRMNAARVWGEGVIHHEFGHHWHDSFSVEIPFNYCNSVCDSGGCGHCLWCNEDLGAAWNEGLADYFGELLPSMVAQVYGPAAYTGAGSELLNFESVVTNSSQCPSGHVVNATINEGFVAALLRDITDNQNDNDPSVGSGVDQLSLYWEEILTTVDLDDPLDIMDFLALFNTRFNSYQSQLVQTALNNGIGVSNSKANIAPYTPGGWAYSLVPRSTNNATGTSAPVSATLSGGTNNTYLNAAMINSGGFPTLNGFANHISVDGATWINLTSGALWNGSWAYGLNLGPYNLAGGRHTVGVITDAGGAESESNESDNQFGRQWIWTPPALATGVTTRNAPPIRNGGWGTVPVGSQTLYYNSEGFRLSSSGVDVQGVAVRSANANDYDLYAHAPSTGSQDGFGALLANSALTAAFTDFILVNYRVATVGDRDFGVVNTGGGSGQYLIERSNDASTTTVTAIGQTRVHSIFANQFLQVGEVFTPVGQSGSTYLQVDVSPVTSPVSIAWYDAATGVESRSSASATATTDASGRARLFLNTTENTYTPFAIFRDTAQGLGPVTVTITANATPAELVTTQAVGSFGPVVPHDTTVPLIPAGNPVPAPTTLIGDQGRTNIYISYRNTGPRASLQHDVAWLIDGSSAVAFDFGIAAANSPLIANVAGAFYLNGGRHTLGMFVDSSNNNSELDEGNNRWAAQWVWTPSTLSLAQPTQRNAPPASNGGWADLPVGTTARNNLDAIRTPVFGPGDGLYAAMAIMPLGSSDHDVYLYETSTGPQSGLLTWLAVSEFGASSSDYVLANFGLTARRAFDVGVLRYSDTDAYGIEVVDSELLGAAPVNPHLASMGTTNLLHVYEVDLAAEPHEIRLENVAGTVNWGFSVHSPSSPFDQKFPETGIAENGAGDGGDESRSIGPLPAGRYGIAVWKSGTSDYGKSGQYRLKILRSSATDVPELAATPRRTALASVQPNPFNPRTVIDFDMASAGPVSIDVFDVAGRHVRSLLSSTQPAGRHEVVWNGVDDAGAQVASGVYVVRMTARNVVDQRRVVLLK